MVQVFGLRPQGQDESNPAAGHDAHGSASLPGERLLSPPSAPKRRGSSREADEAPDKGNKRRRGDASLPKTSWACPYFLHDKSLYRACLKHKLSRISDVRQHIVRKHTQVPYCPTCGETFPHDAQGTMRNSHIVLQSCRMPDGGFFSHPGATSDQLVAIANSPKDSPPRPEERWLQIWDILFAPSPHPEGPLVMPSEAVQVIMDFRDMFCNDGSVDLMVHYFLPHDCEDKYKHLFTSNIHYILDEFVDYVRKQEAAFRAFG